MSVNVSEIKQPVKPTGERRVLAYTRVDMQDAMAVWRRNLLVHLRTWKVQMVAPIMEPIFSVLAFGWGVGALVTSRVQNVPYLTFVGAGILAFTVIMRALFETTYGAYFRMVYQSTYDAILATPVEAESLAFAEILWAVTKALIDAVIILMILILFGAATSPWAILAPLPLVFGSFFIAGLSLGITAHVHDIDSYNFYMAFFFSLIFMCGAWFPIDVLPRPLQFVAWSLPITSAIDLTRAFLTGQFLRRQLLEAFYLLVMAVVFTEWAMRSLRRRMVA
ncbi:MAG TPA: ABC transporter permease [Pyrinomonadaceae bacterium]|jgi:lipooligosaccharide transport system permease protein